MKVFKLPPGVDPTTVTAGINQDNGVLVIEGIKRAEDKADEGKFEAKLDFKGFKREEIKLQRSGNMLTVTGAQASERHESRT